MLADALVATPLAGTTGGGLTVATPLEEGLTAVVGQ